MFSFIVVGRCTHVDNQIKAISSLKFMQPVLFFFHRQSFPAGAWIRGIDWIQTEKMESGEDLWEVGDGRKNLGLLAN